MTACMLRGSFSLEKINHPDRPVFIICQLCKTLFNFGGEKPELLKNQSGDEVSLEGGIIKGQMAAFRDTAAWTWGGAPGREGTPRPRQPGGARGGASQAGQLPAEAGSTRDTGRVSSGPQKGQSLGCQDRCVANWPHRGSAPPLQWGLPYAPHLGVGASGGKEGEGRQDDGSGPVFASPPPRCHEGSLSLCLTAWEMLALGHLACDGAESPEQLAHSTQPIRRRTAAPRQCQAGRTCRCPMLGGGLGCEP